MSTVQDAPNVVMGRFTLKAGSVIHVAGWPVTVTADTEVETNAANIPLIDADRVRIESDGDFVAGGGAPIDLGDKS
jgi:hypothetical protein